MFHDTKFAYNLTGEMTSSTAPAGQVTSYTYNTLGQRTSATSPDAGTTRYKYDQGGLLRFSQDARQAATGKVMFYTYDYAGRLLTTGLYAVAWASVSGDASYAWESQFSNVLSVLAYDAAVSTSGAPWNLMSGYNSAMHGPVKGRIAADAYKSDGRWQIRLYAYDADGRVTQKVIQTQTTGTAVNPQLTATLNYQYDLQGTLLRRSSTVGGATANLWYDYDVQGRLSRMYYSSTSTRGTTPMLALTYNANGTVKERKVWTLPTIPHTYDIRDRLLTIGSLNAPYRFAAAYGYSASGNVVASEFYTEHPTSVAGGQQRRYRYTYTYDTLDRLLGADYAHWGGASYVASQAYGLFDLAYDKNGNITGMKRRNEAGSVADLFTYQYTSGTNQLNFVYDAASVSLGAYDEGNSSFSYDANGNVTYHHGYTGNESTRNWTYDERNLPVQVQFIDYEIGNWETRGRYRYSLEGERYWKEVDGAAGEFYLNDGATALGVFTASGSLVHWNFPTPSGELVGRVGPGLARLYLKDALGSVRVTVDTGGTVQETTDYDPWGLVLNGRSSRTGGATREGYTGHEYDGETGTNYAGARYYMPQFGRWTAVDPLAEMYPDHNPYNYVLNNPLGFTDPTGLCPDDGVDGNDHHICIEPMVVGYDPLPVGSGQVVPALATVPVAIAGLGEGVALGAGATLGLSVAASIAVTTGGMVVVFDWMRPGWNTPAVPPPQCFQCLPLYGGCN